MGRKTKEYFVCDHCGQEFNLENTYNSHLLNHDIVYIGFERGDWKALVQCLLAADQVGITIPTNVFKKLTNMKIGANIFK